MTTKREQILAALPTILGAATAVCANIGRERSRPWSQDVALSVNIVPENDPRQDTGGVDYTDRVLIVNFQITARGDGPTTLADPVVDALHNRLMSNRTINGLAIDIAAGDNDFEWDDADRDYCVVNQRYQILYRTSETNLST
jgi:hypothetical protein